MISHGKWLTRQVVEKLKGARLVDVFTDHDDDDGQDYTCLVFQRKDKKLYGAWVMMDPEGNGPGHLHIQPVRVKR